MRQFCRLYGELDRGEGQRARVEVLASHLQRCDPADAAWTLQLLLGKQRRRLITARRLRLLAQRITGLPPWLLEACHAQVGDTAETIALLLTAQRGAALGDQPPAQRSDTAVTDPEPIELPLHRWMELELPRLAALDEEQQAVALAALWSRLELQETLVLNKLLTGAFRVGVGPGLVIKALARCSGLEESLLQHRLMGPFNPSAASYAALLAPPEADTIPTCRPYPFLLACPLPPDGLRQHAAADWLVEWKWDEIGRAHV